VVYTGGRRIHLPVRLPREALDARWGPANGMMRRRCHHLIGNPIRFLLVDIARLVNLEFGLQTPSLLLAALLACTQHTGGTTAGTLALQYPALAGAQRHRRGWWAA
jgi:hypothetical protein